MNSIAVAPGKINTWGPEVPGGTEGFLDTVFQRATGAVFPYQRRDGLRDLTGS